MEPEKRIKASLREFLPEAAVLVILVSLVWIAMAKGIMNDRDLIQPILWHLMILTGIVALILACARKMTYERLIGLILFAGLAMRIGFVLYKPTYAAYHDLGEITTEGYYGHASYVLKIFETGRLPDENLGQYYHPPFFHILAACAMKVTGKVLHITDEVYLFEATKIISCAATCFTLLTFRKILRELNTGRTATVIALSIGAFLPINYMLGGWINNDALVTFFMTWIILYTIRWYKNPAWGNTILLALGFGLGMFTKISCAILAFYTGIVMLIRFWKSIREKSWKGLLWKFALFLAIAAPIGLFFPIRNYLMFGQGLNFVLVPGENVYCGDHSWVERFITFPISRLLSPVYLDPFTEYNLNFYLIKSAVVGEFEYHHVEEWPAAVLIVSNLVLVVQAVFSTVCVSARQIKTRRMNFHLWGLLGLWIWIYLNDVILNIRLPYGCTMDFRYIVPTAFIGAVFLGMYTEECLKKRSPFCLAFAGICIAALLAMTGAGMYMFSNMFKF
jgi:4-amino-4-deoxy-L-arabinose transferase-like glycosyltransferase